MLYDTFFFTIWNIHVSSINYGIILPGKVKESLDLLFVNICIVSNDLRGVKKVEEERNVEVKLRKKIFEPFQRRIECRITIRTFVSFTN